MQDVYGFKMDPIADELRRARQERANVLSLFSHDIVTSSVEAKARAKACALRRVGRAVCLPSNCSHGCEPVSMEACPSVGNLVTTACCSLHSVARRSKHAMLWQHHTHTRTHTHARSPWTCVQ